MLSLEYSNLLCSDRGWAEVWVQSGWRWNCLLGHAHWIHKNRVWEAVSLSGYCASEHTASICPIIPSTPSLSLPVRPFSSPGGPTIAHCMHVLVLPWSEATFRRPLVSIAASLEPCDISICWVRAAAWSKLHWFCVQHLFKESPSSN